MCDTGIHFDNSGREKMLIEDQRIASLRFLAFWSNPAWFRATKHASLPDSAIKEWVTYHRLSVAVKKETIVQIIRSVKEVIPNSRLAKHGDFSYDIDFEDMCCVAEDLNTRSHILKADKSVYARRYDFWGSEKETNISDTRDNDLNPASNKSNGTDFNHRVRSLNDWLKELNRVLMEVRQIANEARLLDSWTDTLLKFCLRFVCILRNNENLVKLLNSEIAFIIDYEWLRKLPTSKIEVQSIPQPEKNGDNFFLNNESVDDLWLKLSSSSIRNIWKKEIKVPSSFDNKSQRNKHLVPLMKNNFLRSRQSKILCPSRKTTDFSIEIPKNMETELLGSLLNIINENTGVAFIKAEDAAKNYFPEAHGEWTKHLFPHRANLNTRFDIISAMRKPWDVAPSVNDSDAKVKLENRCSETAALPIQFYKSVPPPTLAARFRPPYMNCQPRNRVRFRPPKSLTSNPPNHQVQYKVPTASLSNIHPPAYVPQTLFPKHCRIRQRLSAPTVNAPGQYDRLNILRTHYQHYNSEGTREPQKYPSKTGENSCAEKISIENETNGLNDAKHECNNAETIALCDIPLPTTAPLVQLSHGYNIPFRIQLNVGNAIGDANKTSQSIVSNTELQLRESRMPLRMNYPIKSVRLQTPMIKMTPPPRNHCISPQFVTKPRFLGPFTVNSLKQIQERLFQQRHQYDYTNNPSHQDLEKSASFENISHLNVISTGYEDKVEKWLKSVNKHLKSGSYINLEELPEFPSVELHEFSSTKLPELPSVESTEQSSVESTEQSSVESTEQSSAELTKLPSIKLPNLSGIELPEPVTAVVVEVSNIELPKLPGVELPALSSIKLSEHSRIESPDIYNESYDGGRGDSEESAKSVDEAPELTKSGKVDFSGDHIKSNFDTLSNTMIGKSRKSKANILKLKKLKARREFFEHLQQLPDIVPKLKSCKNVRRKIKILKKYFAAINSISTGRFPFKNFIEILGKKNQPIKNVSQTKNRESSALKEECCLRKKFDKLSAESNFDMRQSNLLINDISKYKMWIRESQEFNAFPSKRLKLGKSQTSFLQTKTLIRDEQDRWISSLNYFDSIIDELFFADNGIEKILHRNQNRTMDAETNGWTHFKVAVKTVMRNIISSLDAKIS